MEPIVSLIMPAYNAEKYIAEAIDSILAQTLDQFELIIVEDGSTDGTLEIIKQYDDSRIRLFVNEKNCGIAFSTNRGIANARGKYIALMDDDDRSVPERFELQVTYLENHPEIDVLGGRSIDIDENGELIRRGGIPRNNPRLIKAILHFRCMDFRNGTTMFRKEFVVKNNLYYRENCCGMQDYRFFIDCSKVGNISTIEDVLLIYRIHSENETRRQMTQNSRERATLYARFQRESLEASGYHLCDESLSDINRFMVESGNGCKNQDDLARLYSAFKELLAQAKEMKVDYYTELEMYCKQQLAMQYRGMLVF